MELKVMILKRIFQGLGTGSFIFLLIRIFNKPAYLDAKMILFVFLLSGFIGLMTFIFDIEIISPLVAVSIHFIAILLFVFVFDLIWDLNFSFIAVFISSALIYIFSYFIVYINLLVTTNKLNDYVRKMNKQ
ncbi:DUF3021 family protein [Oenococcus oeni]|uniref:DUF3021 domain-containing protein n=8 Tax=Oenococcus oeni TaxID=1247 RepID=A0NKY3_OENOE|nr:DUF3021 family protein [Oenococcus oeni]EAV38851.1 hypothetical protein OENOO_65053 [Oenococcus oeni ATCC BAA-1163]KEP87041.1 hypothetical protein X279_09450 [Oenococcus oeni IOEB_0501]KGH58490.1 hypothetical protein X288_07450 [Oenococcus oeni IOEB_9805]KGH63601.1 hypothetical protein X375_01880 [Oenococcus oeni S13]KGH64474.1 hypothetical protein X291_09615 [Oenococcus oeni IOEB_C23]KGH71429.1 hypothetical protein X280_08760 [Oenococcus oeni IOEB_0502]KGH75515.1 hypothetical protein X28